MLLKHLLNHKINFCASSANRNKCVIINNDNLFSFVEIILQSSCAESQHCYDQQF